MFSCSTQTTRLGLQLFVLLLLIHATGGQARELIAQEITHPVREYVVHKLEPTAEVTFADSIGGDPELQSVAQMLIGAALEMTFGVFEGPEEEVFGKIEDVAATEAGRLYVLDSQAKQVRIFGRNGEYVQTIGGPGQGPGEFSTPLSVAVDVEGRVYVGDLTRQIHVFERGAIGLEYTKSFRLNVDPQDMCIMGDRLFVHGMNLELNRIVHVFDKSGGMLFSFGSVYSSDNPVTNARVSQGRIVCDTVARMVVYAPSSLIPEVRGYTMSGELVWLTTISGYRPIHFAEALGGRTKVRVPRRGYHHVRALTAIPPASVLLQVAFRSYESYMAKEEFAELHTLLFDVQSGHAISVGRSLSPVVAATQRFYVTARRDPFPRLERHLFPGSRARN